MKITGPNPSRFVASGRTALMPALVLAAALLACRSPEGPDSIKCHDRSVHINRDKAHAVEEETVVVCHTKRATWSPRHDEKWSLHFEVSPYQGGVKDIAPGVDPGPFVVVDQDTAFKYSITVDGKTFDPQLILIGGH
jgi:hypothetical protein